MFPVIKKEASWCWWGQTLQRHPIQESENSSHPASHCLRQRRRKWHSKPFSQEPQHSSSRSELLSQFIIFYTHCGAENKIKAVCFCCQGFGEWINSLWTTDTKEHHVTWLALLQILICCLFIEKKNHSKSVLSLMPTCHINGKSTLVLVMTCWHH